jgi:hypothetical protein
MKVAIAFIGTGKYLNFLPKYYENIQKHFLPNSEKTFLVFTDGQLEELPSNIIPYYQEHLEWPFITLKRFEIINRARDIIEKNDWFVFIDADALVIDDISEDEFFTEKPFFGVHHPCHFMKMNPHTQPPGAFDTNERSEAYVNTTEEFPDIYYQGCLWGGRVPEVCKMIDTLEERTNKDLKNNIVALWHDESHINKFFIENKKSVHCLGPEYAYPEIFSSYCNFEPKIVHLAKDNSKYQV